jgi:hypothetical protein
LSRDCQRKPRSCHKAKTGQRKNWERNPEQLKAIDRNMATQHRVAALKNPEHPQIDVPKDLGTRRVLKGRAPRFRAQGRDKEREGSQELQFEKPAQDFELPLKFDPRELAVLWLANRSETIQFNSTHIQLRCHGWLWAGLVIRSSFDGFAIAIEQSDIIGDCSHAFRRIGCACP